uniref:Insulin-like growth factor-binding protein 1 n=2 Tax=Rousettus aegyptiacus TaxID=9407 RepID=A0A7J8D5Y9_ROUAE|nr:insulin like growth factor binding protein 1 [Rousettus aegyptiacus]
MPAIPSARAWPLLLLLAVPLGAAASAPQPWQCAPCSAERLALCPPVPASCPEITRPAGCGCCPTCALPLGAACGMATARCGRGLSCRPLPGEPRPLHALARGRGACMAAPDSPAPGAEATDAKGLAAPQSVSPGSTEITKEELPDSFHLAASSSEDLPTLWKAVSSSQSIRALGATDIQKWKEPCRRELYEVLERLAKQQQGARGSRPHKFYLPNCHRSGFYHPKQCEASLDGEAGLCWCVYPWSGKRIPESAKVRGDPNCPQYFH